MSNNSAYTENCSSKEQKLNKITLNSGKMPLEQGTK